jgi:hypothetical protein
MLPSEQTSAERSPRWITVMHVAVVVLLAGGALWYWLGKAPAINPMTDPGAAEAMALVQTHPAKQAPTILQAVSERVRHMKERGQGVRLGEWRVEKDGAHPDRYLVKTFIREQGFQDWFEREYLWRVDLKRKRIEPLSLPAEELMALSDLPANPLVPPSPAP